MPTPRPATVVTLSDVENPGKNRSQARRGRSGALLAPRRRARGRRPGVSPCRGRRRAVVGYLDVDHAALVKGSEREVPTAGLPSARPARPGTRRRGRSHFQARWVSGSCTASITVLSSSVSRPSIAVARFPDAGRIARQARKRFQTAEMGCIRAFITASWISAVTRFRRCAGSTTSFDACAAGRADLVAREDQLADQVHQAIERLRRRRRSCRREPASRLPLRPSPSRARRRRGLPVCWRRSAPTIPAAARSSADSAPFSSIAERCCRTESAIASSTLVMAPSTSSSPSAQAAEHGLAAVKERLEPREAQKPTVALDRVNVAKQAQAARAPSFASASSSAWFSVSELVDFRPRTLGRCRRAHCR